MPIHRLVAVASLVWAMPVVAQKATVTSVATQNSSRIADGQGISVSFDNQPLRDAVRIIVAKSQVPVTYSAAILPEKYRVTYAGSGVSTEQALSAVLKATGIVVERMSTGALRLKRSDRTIAQGNITGKVTDVKNGKGIPGVSVSVDNGNITVASDGDGVYRLTGISAGAHTVTARLVGYAKQSRLVTIGEGVTVAVDFKLEPSANVLDQIIVTGTVVQTELKAVPSAITVITAKQIEERGITKIDQLFRGDIPGLFAENLGSGALLDEVTMFSRGTTSLNDYELRQQTFVFTGFSNPIKTYVDGIELADPKYLSQIDPKSIERIEILSGPQASTIYGSNAINGVMQIFTKRGTTNRPQLSLSLLSGWVENNFSSARTPQHDYSAQVSGLEGRLSYNVGGSWNYMGPWTPAKQLSRTNGFGGARLDLPTPAGGVTADMTLRRSTTRSLQRGDVQQTTIGYQETGWWNIGSIPTLGLARPTTRTLTGQTLGFTLSYVPASWWSHELGFGQDVSDAEMRATARRYASISEYDTTLSLSQSHTDRRSLRYTTTARLPVTSLAQLTVTSGADAWQNLMSAMVVESQTLAGTLAGKSSISRQPNHNSGGFLQTQLGVKDRLFLTYGLRAEWNPGFGAEEMPNIAPRYGVAYTQDVATPLGSLTAKMRASFGRSTRPPQPKLKASQTITENGNDWLVPFYGNFDYYLANTELGPEHQQGGEGGLELFFGSRGSLVVTRYNQTVDGLIAAPAVDSVRSLAINPPSYAANNYDTDGYGYYYQYSNVNLGSIRNQGWELQGSVNTGPLTTRGTYSWTKSRVAGVTPKYRAYFTDWTQYQPGATFTYLPEHTWALGTTYALAKSSVSLNITGVGRLTNLRSDFFNQNFSSQIRLPQNRSRMNARNYVFFNTGYALADLTASHRFAPRIEGVLQVQNLTDRYTNDLDASYASMGRQLKAGLRLR